MNESATFNKLQNNVFPTGKCKIKKVIVQDARRIPGSIEYFEVRGILKHARIDCTKVYRKL